jgi:hypothetical protein
MNVTVYIHPMRLLVATWQVEDHIPVLYGYKELAPDYDLDLRSARPDSVSIILHSTSIRLHWFPLGDHAQLSDTSSFEQSAWFVDESFVPLPSESFTSVLTNHDSTMHASIAVHTVAAERIERIAGSSARISVDLDLDIQAALSSTAPRSAPWLLLGRRGSIWHAVIINELHRPSAYASFLHDDDYSYSGMVSLIRGSLAARHSVDVSAVMIFGDHVSAEEIADLKGMGEQSGFVVARLQPFKHLRSALDSLVEQKVIKRAHALAPLAGSMLPLHADASV